MGSWFVRPETATVPLSDGQSLTVHKRLTAGQQRQRFARIYQTSESGALRVNHLQVGMALITAYLIEWTLTDEAGHPVPLRGLALAEVEATIDNLAPERYNEIREAIEQHEGAMLRERMAEQKKTDGESASSVISISPADVGGGTSGWPH